MSLDGWVNSRCVSNCKAVAAMYVEKNKRASGIVRIEVRTHLLDLVVVTSQHRNSQDAARAYSKFAASLPLPGPRERDYETQHAKRRYMKKLANRSRYPITR